MSLDQVCFRTAFSTHSLRLHIVGGSLSHCQLQHLHEFLSDTQPSVTTCSIFPTLGVAVIFAQFSINQFRSIAWYNVAVGLAVIVTQLLIFRGESSCHKPTNCSWKSSKAKQKPKLASPKKSKLSRMTSISVSMPRTDNAFLWSCLSHYSMYTSMITWRRALCQQRETIWGTDS